MDHPRTAGWKVRVAPSRGIVLNEPTRQALRARPEGRAYMMQSIGGY
jgi:hypothetical protein